MKCQLKTKQYSQVSLKLRYMEKVDCGCLAWRFLTVCCDSFKRLCLDKTPRCRLSCSTIFFIDNVISLVTTCYCTLVFRTVFVPLNKFSFLWLQIIIVTALNMYSLCTCTESTQTNRNKWNICFAFENTENIS